MRSFASEPIMRRGPELVTRAGTSSGAAKAPVVAFPDFCGYRVWTVRGPGKRSHGRRIRGLTTASGQVRSRIRCGAKRMRALGSTGPRRSGALNRRCSRAKLKLLKFMLRRVTLYTA